MRGEHKRGAYLVDLSTAVAAPSSPAWTGRILHVWPDGRCQLVTPTGYAWTAAPGDLRPATEEERAAYDAQVRGIQRERAALYQRLHGGAGS
ncbi:hypothetical protein [Streptomyces albus]|uniref:hypothetical protein n=1 Tax=Streptomyces sp. NRRL F-5917 TaxID=1463873 RepID=UPI0004BE816D|nr:hypothetical protein [Streptomyces sp. NRRL F-5917]